MEPLSGEKTGKKRLIGRRKSDWMIPIAMWTVALVSLLMARHFWLRANDAEKMSAMRQQQVHILEKQVERLEGPASKSGPTKTNP